LILKKTGNKWLIDKIIIRNYEWSIVNFRKTIRFVRLIVNDVKQA
jgi:hypothetical protein